MKTDPLKTDHPKPTPPQISVRQVGKTFSSRLTALEQIDLEVRRGEFVCLLGPSGCGKSTLLNMIAGFDFPSSGSIAVEDRPVIAPGPDRGMVFQQYALYPWKTVFDNIALPLRAQKIAKPEIDDKVDRVLALLRLGEFADRYPAELSGGMRQRVAIARVLVLDSSIMLMDEPFAALDALTRQSLQNELLKVWELNRKTILFVTHSVEEAICLADRIVVLTYRPGTVKADIRIDLPRPRDFTTPAFNQLKRQISAMVMEEQMRYEDSQLLAV